MVGFEVHVLEPHEAFEIFDQRLEAFDAAGRHFETVSCHLHTGWGFCFVVFGFCLKILECRLRLAACGECRLKTFLERIDFLVDRFFSLVGNAGDLFEVGLIKRHLVFGKGDFALDEREVDFCRGIPLSEIFGRALDQGRATGLKSRVNPRRLELPLGGAICGGIAIANRQHCRAHGLLGGFHFGHGARQQALIIEQ